MWCSTVLSAENDNYVTVFRLFDEANLLCKNDHYIGYHMVKRVWIIWVATKIAAALML